MVGLYAAPPVLSAAGVADLTTGGPDDLLAEADTDTELGVFRTIPEAITAVENG